MISDLDQLADKIVARLGARYVEDDVLDTAGAATLLLISETSVLRLATRGQLPGKKLGGLWRFRRSTLLDFISNKPCSEEPA